jgi:hypothetical protein
MPVSPASGELLTTDVDCAWFCSGIEGLENSIEAAAFRCRKKLEGLIGVLLLLQFVVIDPNEKREV